MLGELFRVISGRRDEGRPLRRPLAFRGADGVWAGATLPYPLGVPARPLIGAIELLSGLISVGTVGRGKHGNEL